jgi:ABC-type lipoprotein export system ATPase subunit
MFGRNKKTTRETPDDVIIKSVNLKKIYNSGKQSEVKAVYDVDLEIKKGEIVAIMGPSGSGKTTLLNLLSGIDEATSGKIYIDGQDLQTMKDTKKTKYRASKMGFIFQTFNLIPVLTALENVQLPLLINGMSPRASKKRALEMLDVVGLKNRANHKPAELSGGQRQRVTIARALVHKPAVIWADEPTGNLDRKTAFEVFDMILDLNKKYNQTTVVVTHDEEIAKRTQRIIKMESGRIVR